MPVRRGVLLLGPENVVVLGGQARSLLASALCPRSMQAVVSPASKLTAVCSSQVERLEAARQKAMTCWHQPAVGRSTRPNGGAAPNLYAEASAAAWSELQPPGPQAAMAGPAGPPGGAAPPAAPGGSHGTMPGFQRASDLLHGVPQQAPCMQPAAGQVGCAAAAGKIAMSAVAAQAGPAQPAWPCVTGPAMAPRPALAALLGPGVAQVAAAPGARPPLDDDDDELAEPALDNYRPMSGGGAPAFVAAGAGTILPDMQRPPAAGNAPAERRACSMHDGDNDE